jgi:N-acetylmuramoyl-L-alanine amidase
MYINRIAIIIILVLGSFSISFSEDVKVLFKNNPQATYTAKLLKKNNFDYISIQDFAELLMIKSSITKTGKRIDLTLTQGNLRFEVESPFILIKTKATNSYRVEQTILISFIQDEEIFVPIDILLKCYNNLTNLSLQFNSKDLTLSIPTEINSPALNTKTDPSTLSISEKANGYTIRIPLKTNYKITHKYLKDENKVVIKFPTGNLNLKYTEQTDDNELIEKITFVNHPSSSELSLYLTQALEGMDVHYSESSQALNILLFKNFNVDSLFKAERESKISGTNDNDKNLDTQRKKWEITNIIIDPGHGGRDPGCIGITKKYEKDIVLKIGLKLGRLIERKTNIKVHYTRKTDTLIHVDKRGQIANDKKGNLFISLHCNSVESRDPKANGFSAYILRPGRTDEAIAVAERENSVIKYEPGYQERYKHLSEENFILTTIAQSAFIKFSETFAEKLCLSVQKNKLPLKNNGVLQAGFYVLVGASMPSVLVECGYLTNKEDEAFLNSDSGQTKLAEAIFSAILAYQQEYEKSLNEGK